jgi:ketosteroid isomerase-like protein
MTMTDPATRKPPAGSGSYLTVWKKQADGGWKAVEDFVTPGPGAAQ